MATNLVSFHLANMCECPANILILDHISEPNLEHSSHLGLHSYWQSAVISSQNGLQISISLPICEPITQVFIKLSTFILHHRVFILDINPEPNPSHVHPHPVLSCASGITSCDHMTRLHMIHQNHHHMIFHHHPTKYFTSQLTFHLDI